MSSPNNMQEMRKNPNQRLMAVKLKNFKSIVSQEIPLSPLSVFVGSNSSGKTTVIQSVLTRMRAKSYGKNTMSLNRDRSKLISFSRIKRENSSKEEKIGIGFKLKFDSIPSSRGIFGGSAIQPVLFSKHRSNVEDIEVNQFFELSEPDDIFSNLGVTKIDAVDMSMVITGNSQRTKVTRIKSKIPDLETDSHSALLFYMIRDDEEDVTRSNRLDLMVSDGIDDVEVIQRGRAIRRRGPVGKNILIRDAPLSYGQYSTEWQTSRKSEVSNYEVAYLQIDGQKVEDLVLMRRDLTKSSFLVALRLLGDSIFDRGLADKKKNTDISEKLKSEPFLKIILPQIVSWVNTYFKCMDVFTTEKLDFDGENSLFFCHTPGLKEFFRRHALVVTEEDFDLLRNYQKALIEAHKEAQSDLMKFEAHKEAQSDLMKSDRAEVDDQLSLVNSVTSHLPAKRKCLDAYEAMSESEKNQIISAWPRLDENSKEILLNELSDHINDQIDTTFSAGLILDDIGDVSALNIASEMVERYFDDHVFHVGPIRKEPASGDLIGEVDLRRNEVGVKGEYTTSQLMFTKDAMTVTSVDMETGSGTAEPVDAALNFWLGPEGLGLFDEHRVTEYEGRYESLSVVPVGSEQGEFRYLTELGVGVSQVLPVVLQILLAEPGDLIMLEQPELHLHPAAQLKLADFFLWAVRTGGRQIILETHSEYLISRLASMAAEDDDNEVQDLLSIHLVEQNSSVTEYNEAEINEYGEIDWPSDFFDEGPKEALRTLEAALKKSKKADS